MEINKSCVFYLFLRPLEITTEEFSKKWGTFTYEKKLKLQYTVSKPEEFMEAVKSKLNFHLIQIIGIKLQAASQ